MTSGRFEISDERTTNSTTATTTTTSAVVTADSSNEPARATSSCNDITEHIKKFIFTSTNSAENVANSRPGVVVDKLEIKIPELLQGGYSFYTWPAAPILAWFLWERRNALLSNGKRILELGAGTALPSILAAKCGARVIITDNCILPKSLAHIRKSCLTNNLIPGQDIEIVGLSWGLLLNSVFNLGNLDLIIAADCFYDPTVFEDIIVSVAFLLERNPEAKFLFTYQERSADWSIEALLKKWKLYAVQVNIDDIGKSAGVDLGHLIGGHTIHLIEIARDN